MLAERVGSWQLTVGSRTMCKQTANCQRPTANRITLARFNEAPQASYREGVRYVRRIAIVCLIVLLASCNRGGKNDQQYQTAKVDRGNITMTVTATGTLSAVTTVQVGSQVSGVISRLYADFNSHVKKGQLLAELDPTPFEQQVAQRQADLTKAKVDAANAKVSYNRQARLAASGLAAQADLDSAKAQYDA